LSFKLKEVASMFKVIITRDFDHMSEVASRLVAEDIKENIKAGKLICSGWRQAVPRLVFINIWPGRLTLVNLTPQK